MTREVGQPRGILRYTEGPGVFHHARLPPSDEHAATVQHFWIVRWDLRGHPPRTLQTLPHPTVHLVVESGRSRCLGVHTGQFTAVLEGQGGAFGIKFRPGGFRGFLGRSVSTLRDRELPLREVLGRDAEFLESALAIQRDDAQLVAAAESFLTDRALPPDPRAERAGKIVDDIAADRGITAVEQLLDRWQTTKRPLQQLFNEYVGVGPKWVINRYRLHEALERLGTQPSIDFADLALELGYFDQAHFIRDFTALVGRSPAAYARRRVLNRP